MHEKYSHTIYVLTTAFSRHINCGWDIIHLQFNKMTLSYTKQLMDNFSLPLRYITTLKCFSNKHKIPYFWWNTCNKI